LVDGAQGAHLPAQAVHGASLGPATVGLPGRLSGGELLPPLLAAPRSSRSWWGKIWPCLAVGRNLILGAIHLARYAQGVLGFPSELRLANLPGASLRLHGPRRGALYPATGPGPRRAWAARSACWASDVTPRQRRDEICLPTPPRLNAGQVPAGAGRHAGPPARVPGPIGSQRARASGYPAEDAGGWSGCLPPVTAGCAKLAWPTAAAVRSARPRLRRRYPGHPACAEPPGCPLVALCFSPEAAEAGLPALPVQPGRACPHPFLREDARTLSCSARAASAGAGPSLRPPGWTGGRQLDAGLQSCTAPRPAAPSAAPCPARPGPAPPRPPAAYGTAHLAPAPDPRGALQRR
jgi:hypothetical protein